MRHIVIVSTRPWLIRPLVVLKHAKIYTWTLPMITLLCSHHICSLLPITHFYAFPPTGMYPFSALPTFPHQHLANRFLIFIGTCTSRSATYVILPTNPSFVLLPTQPLSTLFSTYKAIPRFPTNCVQPFCAFPNSWSDLRACMFKSSSYLRYRYLWVLVPW